jgi:predicted  nucleic acid-binding Zn-ribbon protein
MSTKKALTHESAFDPTVPEEGAVVPSEGSELRDLYSIHLPSRQEISSVAHDMFAGKLPGEVIQQLMQTSTDINESVRRIMHEHMTLGFRFGETVRLLQTAYAVAFGDTPGTAARANADALSYLERLHRMSKSKIRVHLRAYAKFHDNADAVEFLRLTDMQSLLGNDVGDDIVEAIIEKKKKNPEMSTRTVKQLVEVLRQQQDRIAADQERLEAANDEYANLLEQFNSANLESARLRQEIEQVRATQTETQAASDRLRNELSLVAQSKNALHQQLHDMQQELDAARRKVADLATRPPAQDDPQVKEDVRRMNEHFNELLASSQQLEEQIARRTEEAARIEEQLKANAAALEAGQRLEKEMNELIRHFGEFVQRYHSAQLLCTAEGNPRRFAPLFEALADLVGKFHTEIVAARKAA